MSNRDKWIEVFRTAFQNGDVPVEVNQYSDNEILTIAKGIMAPTLCTQLGISLPWLFELYWNAVLIIEPDPSLFDEVDFTLFFKNRAEKNKN